MDAEPAAKMLHAITVYANELYNHFNDEDAFKIFKNKAKTLVLNNYRRKINAKEQ